MELKFFSEGFVQPPPTSDHLSGLSYPQYLHYNPPLTNYNLPPTNKSMQSNWVKKWKAGYSHISIIRLVAYIVQGVSFKVKLMQVAMNNNKNTF